MTQTPVGTHEHSDNEAFIIVKAAPRPSQAHGVTVCSAAIDRNGNWVRLYPISFAHLKPEQRFRRWDRISYRSRRPRTMSDGRQESRRVDAESIEIIGRLREDDRHRFVERSVVTSLKNERTAGRSLAPLKPEVLEFWYERQTDEEAAETQATRKALIAQGDLFARTEPLSVNGIPFKFMYRYRDADGIHTGTCQDWETEATFQRRRSEFGSERQALDWMVHKFGIELPKGGLAFAMGTHRYRHDQWLINGIVQYRTQAQGSFL